VFSSVFVFFVEIYKKSWFLNGFCGILMKKAIVFSCGSMLLGCGDFLWEGLCFFKESPLQKI